jgi:hypothetical protein
VLRHDSSIHGNTSFGNGPGPAAGIRCGAVQTERKETRSRTPKYRRGEASLSEASALDRLKPTSHLLLEARHTATTTAHEPGRANAKHQTTSAGLCRACVQVPVVAKHTTTTAGPSSPFKTSLIGRGEEGFPASAKAAPCLFLL